MSITLKVVAGPHEGLQFTFKHHDTFLVGRSRHAHFQLPAKDRYFSRIHFMVEVNPPYCRLIDMGSHNGTYVNGQRVLTADLQHGDQIRAGHTVLCLTLDGGSEAASVSVPTPQPATSPLAQVPGYSLLKLLGQGSLGRVYLGQRSRDGAQFALKFIRPAREATPEQSEAFLATVRFLMQLDHPHLVRLHDQGLIAMGYYFVYDHVPGQNAYDILQREGPLTVPRALRWAGQLLQALAHAHAHQLVHRDIKPSNILVETVDGKERARLSDHGLARAYQNAPFSGLTFSRDMLGAANFMPPEFLLNFHEAQPAGDQYALAATLYYLLTGASVLEMPGVAQRRFSTLLRQQAVPIRERRPDIPAAVADAIHKALARTPAQRYPDADAFRQALMRAAQVE